MMRRLQAAMASWRLGPNTSLDRRKRRSFAAGMILIAAACVVSRGQGDAMVQPDRHDPRSSVELGCILAPSNSIGHWPDAATPCGAWLMQDSKDPRKLGVLAGDSGQTLARGELPSACQEHCSIETSQSELGPLLVASHHDGAQEHTEHIWLGMWRSEQLLFIWLTPSDAHAIAGEVVHPGAVLEPWNCNGRLALKAMTDVEEDATVELQEREGVYVPDGSGWLIVPHTKWDATGCQPLDLALP